MKSMLHKIAASLVAGFLLSGTAMAAGDGTCLSRYGAMFPSASGKGYVIDGGVFNYPGIRNVVVDLIYRDGFTAGKAPVTVIPRGTNAMRYIMLGSSNYILSGSPPYSSARMRTYGPYGDMGTSVEVASGGTKKTFQYNNTIVADDTLGVFERVVVLQELPPFREAYDRHHSPDINLSNATIEDIARRNSDLLTDATIERLSTYVKNRRVDRGYLDLKSTRSVEAITSTVTFPTLTIRHAGNITQECGRFIELIKHPTLDNVVFLKSILTTSQKGKGGYPEIPLGNSLVEYVPVRLGPSYTPPVIRPDSLSMTWAQPESINPLANDTSEGASLSLVRVSPPARGSIQVSGSRVTYTPVDGWAGTVTVTYEATDGVTTGSSTISFHIGPPPNEAPELRDDHVITNHRSPIIFNVFENDFDDDAQNGQSLRLVSVSKPSAGTVSWDPNGTVTYIPQQGRIGQFVMTYQATDGANPGSARIFVTTEACYENIWQNGTLSCDLDDRVGSTDFAGSCTTSAPGYVQVEVSCPPRSMPQPE